MINFKNSDFCKLLRLCAISALQISKKHFATFDFFAKRKLVLTVWVSTSLSEFGYSLSITLGPKRRSSKGTRRSPFLLHALIKLGAL